MTPPLAVPARQFASAAHVGQLHGADPYITHLDDVCAVLQRFGHTDATILRAAYLHDVVEDTAVELPMVAARFGFDVALLTWAVTNEPGPDRRARFIATAAKIAAVPRAATLKLADRIANVEKSLRAPDHYLQGYRREQPDFERLLYGKGDPDMERTLTALLELDT